MKALEFEKVSVSDVRKELDQGQKQAEDRKRVVERTSASNSVLADETSRWIADLPADVQPTLRRVQLVAPTSTDARLQLAADATDGWLYLVTVTGTTGARAELGPSLAPLAARARRATQLPLYAGFGISTPEHARAATELADGIAVGSRAVEVAEEGPAALHDYVAGLRTALDR